MPATRGVCGAGLVGLLLHVCDVGLQLLPADAPELGLQAQETKKELGPRVPTARGLELKGLGSEALIGRGLGSEALIGRGLG